MLETGGETQTMKDEDPFDGFEISEQWASGASKHEDTASQRATRYSRIGREHERVRKPQPTARKRNQRIRRSNLKWKFGKVAPWIVAFCVLVLMIGSSFIIRGVSSASGQKFADVPPAGVGEQPQRILPVVPSNGSKDFIVSQTNPDGSPVGFSPCRPWRVVVNTADAPPGAYPIVVDAVATISQVTGLQIALEGLTDESVANTDERKAYQPERYGDTWAPILVQWGTQTGDDFAGLGGPIMVTDPETNVKGNVTGTVILNRDASMNTNPAQLRAVLLHELGHVVGLSHAAGRDQLMFAENSGLLNFSAGDLAGLAAVGGAKCTPNL